MVRSDQIGRLAGRSGLFANLVQLALFVQLAANLPIGKVKNRKTWPAYLEAYPIWPIGRLAADPIVTA